MPHMDMEGSFDGSADYSDYEYQTVVARHQLGGDGSNADSTVLFEEDVLGGIGGLSNNEVAELVAYELIADLEEDTELGNQTVESFVEGRGIFGINLPADNSILPLTLRGNQNDGQVITDDPTLGTILSGSQTDDRILQMYRTGFHQNHTDSDRAGGGSNNQFTQFKNYRQLTGRGPVLDSNDNVALVDRMIIGNSVRPVEANIRVHCIWDIAEVDDAGRAFSVPSDD